jgi:hypothetical protein
MRFAVPQAGQGWMMPRASVAREALMRGKIGLELNLAYTHTLI